LGDQFNWKIVQLKYKELVLFANFEIDGNWERGIDLRFTIYEFYFGIYNADTLAVVEDPASSERGNTMCDLPAWPQAGDLGFTITLPTTHHPTIDLHSQPFNSSTNC